MAQAGDDLSAPERGVVSLARQIQRTGDLRAVVVPLSQGGEAAWRAREALLLLMDLDPVAFVNLTMRSMSTGDATGR